MKQLKVIETESKSPRPIKPARWQVQVKLVGDELEVEIYDPADPRDIDRMWEPGGASHFK